MYYEIGDNKKLSENQAVVLDRIVKQRYRAKAGDRFANSLRNLGLVRHDVMVGWSSTAKGIETHATIVEAGFKSGYAR